MPKNDSTKKPQEQGEQSQEQEKEVPIVELDENNKGQETEQGSRNQDQDQGKSNEKEPEGKGKEEGKSGGLLGLLVSIIQGIADAIFGTPEQEQSGDRGNSPDQQKRSEPQQITVTLEEGKQQEVGKDPKDLDQETVEKAGEGLREGVQKSDAGNQSVGTRAPDETPAKAQLEAKQEKDGSQIG